MSYCVHCGVRLASYETICPLCGTPVNDPNGNPEKDEPRFGEYIETTDRKVNRHFIFKLITALAFVPFIITAIVDFCLNHSFSWSLLVLGGEFVLWVFILVPFRYNITRPSTFILFDTLAVAALLLLITLIFRFKWYLSLGLPLVLVTGLFIYVVVIILIEGKPRKLMAFGSLFFALSIYLGLIDIIISHYVYGSFQPQWSYWPFVPLFTIGVISMLFSRSRKISSWLKKKLFI